MEFLIANEMEFSIFKKELLALEWPIQTLLFINSICGIWKIQHVFVEFVIRKEMEFKDLTCQVIY